MVGRKTITRTRTGTHPPCIQSGSTLFPSQPAFEYPNTPARQAPLWFQRNIWQRREAPLRRLLVKCGLSAGISGARPNGSFRGSPDFAAPEIPDCAAPAHPTPPPPLLQFGRRGTVERIAPGALQQFERVGFDRERSALARQFGD